MYTITQIKIIQTRNLLAEGGPVVPPDLDEVSINSKHRPHKKMSVRRILDGKVTDIKLWGGGGKRAVSSDTKDHIGHALFCHAALRNAR